MPRPSSIGTKLDDFCKKGITGTWTGTWAISPVFGSATGGFTMTLIQKGTSFSGTTVVTGPNVRQHRPSGRHGHRHQSPVRLDHRCRGAGPVRGHCRCQVNVRNVERDLVTTPEQPDLWDDGRHARFGAQAGRSPDVAGAPFAGDRCIEGRSVAWTA